MWNILFPHVTHCLSINVPLVKKYRVSNSLQITAGCTNFKPELYSAFDTNLQRRLQPQYLNGWTIQTECFLGNMCGIYLSNSHSFQWRWKTGVNSPAFVWLFFKLHVKYIRFDKTRSMEIWLWLRSVQILPRRICQWCLLLEFWNALREKSNILNLSIMLYKVSVFSTGNFIHSAW